VVSRGGGVARVTDRVKFGVKSCNGWKGWAIALLFRGRISETKLDIENPLYQFLRID